MPTAHGLPLPPSGVVIDGAEVLWLDKEIGGEWFTYQFTVAEVVASLGGGTVTSVGLSLPAMFTVSGTPVTGAGTLAAVLANQTANRVLVGPATGSPAVPTFRALVWTDLPLPSDLSGTSGVTGANLVAVEQGGVMVQATVTQILAAFSFPVEPKNTVYSGPVSGADATPTFRALAWDDIPLIDVLSGVSGVLGSDLVVIESSGIRFQATISQIIAGVGTGTVTSVNVAVPAALLTASGGPITGAGTITLALAAQAATKFFIGPASGADAAPSFRLINWNDDLPRYSSVASTSGLDGDEHILVEKGGSFLQTTTLFLATLMRTLVNVFYRNQSVNPILITTGGTYTPDAALTNNWQITISSSITLANPTNLTAGMVLNFCLDENSTGGFTISLGNLFKFGSGTVPTWVTTANAKNFLTGYYDGTVIRCGAAVGLA